MFFIFFEINKAIFRLVYFQSKFVGKVGIGSGVSIEFACYLLLLHRFNIII